MLWVILIKVKVRVAEVRIAGDTLIGERGRRKHVVEKCGENGR